MKTIGFEIVLFDNLILRFKLNSKYIIFRKKRQ
jgi:hypothetical protein